MVHSARLDQTDPAYWVSEPLDAVLAAAERVDAWSDHAAEVLDFVHRRRVLQTLVAGADADELEQLSTYLTKLLHPRRAALLAVLRVDFTARWTALRDLIDDRLRVVQDADPAKVLAREHVRAILRWIDGRARAGNTAPQAELREAMKLRKPNLTRLINLLVDHGLVQRTRVGRENLLQLTATASEHESLFGSSAARNSARDREEHDAPPSSEKRGLLYLAGRSTRAS